MVHFRILYTLAMTLMVFSLFVLWVWTGPIGILVAAALAHGLLRVCERQTDAQAALARKTREGDLTDAFKRG
ncbi:MAG: hypothetical protein AAF376_15140 [Pseudomonadota bacterium]